MSSEGVTAALQRSGSARGRAVSRALLSVVERPGQGHLCVADRQSLRLALDALEACLVLSDRFVLVAPVRRQADARVGMAVDRHEVGAGLDDAGTLPSVSMSDALRTDGHRDAASGVRAGARRALLDPVSVPLTGRDAAAPGGSARTSICHRGANGVIV